MSKLNIDSIFISALDKINFDELREVLYERVKEMHVKIIYNSFILVVLVVNHKVFYMFQL